MSCHVKLLVGVTVFCRYMNNCRKDTGRSKNKGSKKLFVVATVENLFYTPLLRWYMEIRCYEGVASSRI